MVPWKRTCGGSVWVTGWWSKLTVEKPPMSLSLMRLHRSRSSAWSKCISGKGLDGERRPSSLSAARVSGGACTHATAELTEVGEALELVQTPLDEARREAHRCWSHGCVRCVLFPEDLGEHTAQSMDVNDAAVVSPAASRFGWPYQKSGDRCMCKYMPPPFTTQRDDFPS